MPCLFHVGVHTSEYVLWCFLKATEGAVVVRLVLPKFEHHAVAEVAGSMFDRSAVEMVRQGFECLFECWPVDVGGVVVMKLILPVVQGVILSDVFLKFVWVMSGLFFIA